MVLVGRIKDLGGVCSSKEDPGVVFYRIEVFYSIEESGEGFYSIEDPGEVFYSIEDPKGIFYRLEDLGRSSKD